MYRYRYHAVDGKGLKQAGKITASDQQQAARLLIEKQLTPIHIVKHESAYWLQNLPLINHLYKISAKERCNLTSILATLIEANLTVHDALLAIAKQSSKSLTKNCITYLHQSVYTGASLAQAMALQPHNFNSSFIASISAGEKSGELAQVLRRLAIFQESRLRTRKQFMSALLYPAIVLCVAILVVIILLQYVMPDITQVMIGQNQSLPLLTQGLLNLSASLDRHWHWLLIALLFMVALLVGLHKIPIVRYHVGKSLLRLPFIGRFLQALHSSEICTNLAMLTTSGVLLIDALTDCEKLINNSYLQTQLRVIKHEVINGRSFAEALQIHPLMPPVALSLIASGELSGQLVAMLDKAGASLTEQLQQATDLILALIEPVTTLIMGGLVLMIVLAILLPIFEINQMAL